jgi:hypothetical protein
VTKVSLGDGTEEPARGRSLQRERRHLFGNVFDANGKALGVLRQPAQTGVGGGPAETILGQPRHRPIVDHLSTLVAPGGVVDLTDGERAGIARDDAIDQRNCIAAGDEVLEQWGDVDERRRVADGVVLVLVMRLVGADRVEAGPLAVVQTLAQRKGAFVDGGADRHHRDYSVGA